jgi:hypothetical protein
MKTARGLFTADRDATAKKNPGWTQPSGYAIDADHVF